MSNFRPKKGQTVVGYIVFDADEDETFIALKGEPSLEHADAFQDLINYEHIIQDAYEKAVGNFYTKLFEEKKIGN